MNWIRENRSDGTHLNTLVSLGAHNKLSPEALAKITKLRDIIEKM